MNYQFEFKFSQRYEQGYEAGSYCRLYVNGLLAGSCGGGGYDMKGTCVAEWLNKNFKNGLKELAAAELIEAQKSPKYYNDKSGEIYGLITRKFREPTKNGGEIVKTEAYASGGTGLSQMWKILERIGYEIKQNKKVKKDGTIQWLKGYRIYKPSIREFEETLKEQTLNENPAIKRHAVGLVKALKI